jgi:hypothetical protein
MAATATAHNTYDIGGTAKMYVGTIAFDASYPTGGEAIDLGSNERLDIVLCPNNTGYQFSWDAANQKLLVYVGDNDNAADAPGAQVANTTDLSALTAVPFLAVGQ